MRRRYLMGKSAMPVPGVFLFLAGLSFILVGGELTANAQNLATAPPPQARTPWLTSRVVGSPEPPPPYRITRVFPKLTFKNPVDMCSAPGTDRLFLAEQAGQIYSFRNEPGVTAAERFVDLPAIIPGVTS